MTAPPFALLVKARHRIAEMERLAAYARELARETVQTGDWEMAEALMECRARDALRDFGISERLAQNAMQQEFNFWARLGEDECRRAEIEREVIAWLVERTAAAFGRDAAMRWLDRITKDADAVSIMDKAA